MLHVAKIFSADKAAQLNSALLSSKRDGKKGQQK